MSNKIRVHELAKKYDKTSREIIEVLNKIGIKLQSHLSGLDSKDVDKATSHLDSNFILGDKKVTTKTEPKETNNKSGTLRKKIATKEDVIKSNDNKLDEKTSEINKLEVEPVDLSNTSTKQQDQSIEGEKKSYQRTEYKPYQRAEGEQRSYQRTEYKPYQRTEGEQRPYQRTEYKPYQRTEGEQRPYQRTEGEYKPYNRTEGEQRPYQRREGEQRPYQRTEGEYKPYQKAEYKPYQRTEGEQRPYQRTEGEYKPYQRTEYKPYQRTEGEQRSYQRREGEQRPYQRTEGEYKPYQRTEYKPYQRTEGEQRPYQRTEYKPYQRTEGEHKPYQRTEYKPYQRTDGEQRPYQRTEYKPYQRTEGEQRPYQRSDYNRQPDGQYRPYNNFRSSDPNAPQRPYQRNYNSLNKPAEGQYRPYNRPAEGQYRPYNRPADGQYRPYNKLNVTKKDEMPSIADLSKETRRKVDNNKKKVKKDYSSVEKTNKKKLIEEDQKFSSKRRSYKKRKKDLFLKKEKESEILLKEERMITLNENISAKVLGEKIGIDPIEIVKYFFFKGYSFNINNIIPFELAEEFAATYNVLILKEEKLEKYMNSIDQSKDLNLVERAPIITIIGHVDHGKTSLLDAIRKTSVTEQEEGGITQKIGAYQIERNNKKITFIDTPGHEAFSEMRARGTSITDIAVLVLAADDGVMPQTLEAISHSKYFNVPIVVALNKIDKPDINLDKIRQQLANSDILVREWGGEVEMIGVSATKNMNLDKLLDTLVITAEILELKADSGKLAKAVILESKLDSKLGIVANVVVKEGTLKVGDIFVIGNSIGKVRAMTNENGKKLTSALPSTPVEISGLSELPEFGQLLEVAENEKAAKKIVSKFEVNENNNNNVNGLSLEELNTKEYKILLKTDSRGSLEAVKNALSKIKSEEFRTTVVYSATGAVNESDIKLSIASKAKVITFSTNVSASARKEAENKKVDIMSYNIIYKLIEDIENDMKNMAVPKFRDIYQGRLEIKKIFKVSKVGTIAGCLVADGKITKSSSIKIFRNSKEIFEDKINSLKRFNNDVSSVEAGQECGLALENYKDIKEGDILEAYTSEKIINE